MKTPWQKEALFAGQTANGFRTGTVLTLGWFWMRISGCRLVYRGESMETIDFDGILAVAGPVANEIRLPAYLSYEPGQDYYYVVRCANGYGQIEQTLQAAARAAINDVGEIQEPGPNGVFGLTGRQRRDDKVEIVWTYNPIEQASAPSQMRIYSNGGAGNVDFQQPIATVQYKGRKFYRYRSEVVSDGRHQFVVRAADARENENGDMRSTEVEVRNNAVEVIEIISVSGI